MRKITLIVLFLLSLTILTGCSGTNTKSPTSGFVGGSDGIVASFAADNPPAKVIDANQEPFRISLIFENKGETNVAQNNLVTTIEGIDYKAFQITDPNQKNPTAVNAVYRDTNGKVVAGEKSSDISFDAKFKDTVLALTSHPFNVNFCYVYQTKGVSQLCLKKDVVSRAGAKDVCKVSDPKTVSSSAAPIKITSATESVSNQNAVRVVFEFQNVGKGEVYAPNYLSSGTCVSSPSSQLKDKIGVKLYFADSQPSIKCGAFNGANQGQVTLIGGSGRIACDIDTSGLSQTTPFIKPVNVQLDYVYKDTLQKSISVDKSSA